MSAPRSGAEDGADALARLGPSGAQAALGLGLGLSLYGNTFAIADGLTGLSLGGTIGGVLLGVCAVALGARAGRSAFADLGLTRRGLVPSLAAGGLLGLLMALPGVLYFSRPDVAPAPVQVAMVAGLNPPLLLATILGRLLFATALAEELAFRGLLQARLRAAFGSRSAVLIGALFFTAWHIVVSFTTLQSTNLAANALTASAAYIIQTVSVLIAGLLFGLLRERSGNLAGCILAHWLVNTLMLLALYFSRP